MSHVSLRSSARLARLGATGALLLSVASPAAAQSNISTQGFGYPVAGTSTRVSGTAGGLSQFDVITPQNPATLTGINRAALSLQTEPEYRTLTSGSLRESSTVQRIPLLMVGARLGSRLALGLTSSTFLDRNFSTTTEGEVLIDGKPVPSTDITDMRGSISDIRAGVGYRVSSRLSVGLAGHVFTGSNKLSLVRNFTDTLSLGGVLDSSSADFFGRAVSVGALFVLPKGFSAAGSYRAGGRIEAENADTVLTRAEIPNRLSGGLMYTGIPGAAFGVNVEKINWTSMKTLGSAQMQSHDATNFSGGAEVATGRVRGTPVLVRAGAGKSTLPFGVNGGKVSETRLSTGLAIAVTSPGRDQAIIDFSLQRANRKLSGSAVREGAWLLGFGIQIRP